MAHHCCRHRDIARGRAHGGVSVFIRAAFALNMIVTSDARQGVVWLKHTLTRLAFACCYFSPSDSALYKRGALERDPFEHVHRGLVVLESQGFSTTIMGDLNARIGTLSEVPDLATQQVEELLGCPSAGDYDGLPPRHTMDEATPSPSGFGHALLSMLTDTSMVVVNGRTRGDPLGAVTCRHTSLPEHGGGSVVDVAIVAARDFARVADLTVLPALPDCEQHLPVHLQLVLPAAPHGAHVAAAQGEPSSRNKVKVMRPSGDSAQSYVVQVQGASCGLRGVRDTLEADGAGAAVRQLTQLIQDCAKRSLPSRARRSVRAQAGDKPWWDDDLTRARATFFLALESEDPEGRTAARRTYRRLKNWKKVQFFHKQQISLIKTYFSEHQRDFWRVFKDGPRAACPLDDTQAWTGHFEQILNGPQTTRQPLSVQHALLKESLRSSRAAPDLSALNAQFTPDEVAAAIKSLPNNKAADAFGLTAECLKNAFEVVDGEVRYLLAPTLTRIYNQVLAHPGQYPHQFRVNTLTPIFKGKGSDRDMNNYRGIAVGSILGKVFERMLYTRANAAAEKHRLRAPTQCGFRQGHGSLDGMFVLRHLIDQARHNGLLLFCLFVDFEKAFDTVPRSEMLERCRALGMHGPFLGAVTAMYDNILMAVKAQGSLGPTFATTQGTKQGGELSPLLFGFFIEQLHELLLQQCPGMGPVIGGMRVPDILYADDVVCMSTDPAHVQQFLEALELFCTLFGMRVNTGKTYIVVFRSPSTSLPNHIKQYEWLYKGQVVAMRPDFKYLGAEFHSTKGLQAAGTPLAKAGSRAMHVLLTPGMAPRNSSYWVATSPSNR